MGERRDACEVWQENVKGRENLEDLGVNGRIILHWTLKQ